MKRGVDVLQVLNPGQYSSIQDKGRIGFRSYAIPKSGCLDSYAQRLANYLVDNENDEALIEIMGSFSALVTGSCTLGVIGTKSEVFVNDLEIDISSSFPVKKGDVLAIKGSLAYMTIPGGFESRIHFGSASTYSLTKLGGINGDRLQKDDMITANNNWAVSKKTRRIGQDLMPKITDVIRIIKGPEFEGNEGGFEAVSWNVSTISNRMGLRLDGEPWKTPDLEMKTVPVFPGTIQLPSDGNPIVLLNDGQTTGGYPRIGQVIKADLPRVGRKILGGPITFKFVTIKEAREIYSRQETFIQYALKS